MTLLDALCAVNNQQGGTIHQFMGRQDWGPMERAFQDYTRMGFYFGGRKSFEKLADMYHLTINWEGE